MNVTGENIMTEKKWDRIIVDEMKQKYITVMFPYPSGSGLHVGHYYNYAIVDSIAKWESYYRGNRVFLPFGYDAFGLPAENYAIKVGKEPEEVTYENINNFRKQMQHMNTNFEERLITCEQPYYKWSQWIFTKLKEHGLAYKSHGNVNWCPDCKTVIANEQVTNSCCERCGCDVEERIMDQWYFKITDYKERLIKNLDWIDYPKSTIKQQRKWLENLHDWCVSRQRKWGTPIPVEGETDTLDTFVDSSFYYLRYLTDSTDYLIPKEDYQQVDLYIGGAEHACMHLIYARFIHMFLYDIGIVPEEEPFKKVIHQGMITYNDEKMSKSKGNVIDPTKYNSAVIRLYLMFIGPYDKGGDWNDSSIRGIEKFISRMNRWISIDGNDTLCFEKLEEKIDSNIDRMKLNLIVSDLMKFYNENKNKKLDETSRNRLINIIEIFAPNFTNFNAQPNENNR
jgi:leucyl-tRNA synthetase